MIQKTGRKAAQTCAALAGLMLVLASCGKTTPPGVGSGDPYAGGQTYPWTDRVDPVGSDPYAGGQQFPWTGITTVRTITAQALGDTNYLSDLTWTSAQSSWGPVEKDRSNGEQNPGDGKRLTIGTQSFDKGLGVHANSEIVYTLSGLCTKFNATVGLDAEINNNPKASVNFQLFDGTRKLYDSGKLKAASGPVAVDVDVTGVQNLSLVVTDAGDGISYDHADWGDAKVTCPPEQPSGGQFLSDLAWQSASNAWGPIEKDQSNGEQLAQDGHTLTIGTRRFDKGLGVHANSEIVYALGGTCSTFQAVIGLDAEINSNPKASVNFQVFDAARKLYDSGTLKASSAPLPININVTNVQTLRLVVTDAGDGISYDHADWADAKVSCITPPPVGDAKIAVENLDGFPTNTRLVFGTLGAPAITKPNVPITVNGVHDKVILRVKNIGGTGTLNINALPISAGWIIDPPLTLPLAVAPGSFADIPVKFVQAGNASDRKATVSLGALTVLTNDTTTPSVKIDLGGIWQPQPENGVEPDPKQIREAFNFNFSFGSGNLNQKGAVKAQPGSDEVISAYWQRLDPTKPATARQIAAYHSQYSTAYLNWFPQGQPNSKRSILNILPDDAQTLLPRNPSKSPAAGNFSPTTAFGLDVDGEKSDPTLNNATPDVNAGCTAPCGQHMRFFPIKDVPGSYYMMMDYSGINYDYNDNVYVVSNITPAVVAPSPPPVTPITTNAALINAGGTADVTDPASNTVWRTDVPNGTPLFSPSNAISDGAYYSGPILNADGSTNTNPIYRTYRSCPGPCSDSTPQANRFVTFTIPVPNGTYQVNLHFAELFFTEANQRIMDISAQGQVRVQNFDIFANAGAKKIYILRLKDVVVTNGQMTLSFAATKNFVSVSGIQIGN